MSRRADALSKKTTSSKLRDVTAAPVPWEFDAPSSVTPVPSQAPAPAIVPAPVPLTAPLPGPTLMPHPSSSRGAQELVLVPDPPRVAPDERYARKLVGSDLVTPFMAEQYRRLAAALKRQARESGVRRVMVTSALNGEGKTLVASNLALTLSQSYAARVLLLDVDFRRPSLHSVFGVAGSPGLVDLLDSRSGGTIPALQVAPNLSLVVAGAPQRDPMRFLARPALADLLKQSTAQYDWIILDTPPVGLVTDAGVLSHAVDRVVMVVQAGRTPYQLVEKAVATVGRESILGIVLNRTEEAASTPYTDGYGAYYYQSNDIGDPK